MNWIKKHWKIIAIILVVPIVLYGIYFGVKLMIMMFARERGKPDTSDIDREADRVDREADAEEKKKIDELHSEADKLKAKIDEGDPSPADIFDEEIRK